MTSNDIPIQNPTLNTQNSQVALILCGALAREVIALKQRHGWQVELFGVASKHHMQPQHIAPAVERRLRELIPQFERVAVVYGDCGTGGRLDAVLEHYNVPRITGPHCYEMYGGAAFEALMAEEPGTFFLTDFLVRCFRGTVVKGLGLDRFPELQPLYFGNYRRIVYLVQRDDYELLTKAQEIADSLNLPLETRRTGYGALETRLVDLLAKIHEERYQAVLPDDYVEQERASDGDVSNNVLARHPGTGADARRWRARERAAAPTLPGSHRRGGDGSGSDRL